MISCLFNLLVILSSLLAAAVLFHYLKVKASLEFYRKQGAETYFQYVKGLFTMMSDKHPDNLTRSNTEAVYKLVEGGESRSILAANLPLSSKCGITLYTSEMVKEMLLQEDSFQKIPFVNGVTEVTGFFFLNGEEAFRLKSIFSKIFMYEEMTFISSTISKLMDAYIEKFNKENNISTTEYKQIDLGEFLEPLMTTFANFVITGEESIEVPEHIKELNGCFNDIFNASFGVVTHPLFSLLPGLTKKFKLLNFFGVMERAQKRQIEIMEKLLKEREAKDSLTDCVLDRIIKHNRECKEAERLSVRDAVGIYNLLYFAGTDTSKAGTIMMFCYMTEHQDIAKSLREISRQISDSKGHFSVDRLAESEDLDLFVKESLRLFSPVQQQLGRTAIKDVKLGNFTIRKNDRVFINFSVLHKDKTVFEDPFTFDASRFKKENEKLRPKYQYIPFSVGKRVCMGRHLGELMLKVLFAKLSVNYEMLKPEGVEYYYMSFITARTTKPLVMMKSLK